MRPRPAIFIPLLLSLPFVAAARLIWNAGGESGNVVRKYSLVNKVELIGDQKESGPFPEKDAWASVDDNVIAPIHDRARFCDVDRASSAAGLPLPYAPSACFAIVMDVN